MSPMTADKKYAPDSLKYQWRLLGNVLRSDWATGLDKTVAYEVIDNYRKDHGNSRASLRYLEKATGAARQNVIVSLRRICENGPFSVARKGAGVRPTEYNLHFDTVAENASGHAGDTASNPARSGHAGSTASGHAGDTAETPSGHAGSTESVLQVDGLQAGLLDRMIDPAAPTAPPLAGLSAATAWTAVEGLTLKALLVAYAPVDMSKPARAAYKKAWDALPADTNRAAVIEAAAAWHASWAAQGNPDAPRKGLARWLADEMYRKPAPRGFQRVEKATKPKPRANVPEDPEEEEAPDMGRRQDSGSYAAEMAERARRIRRAAIVIDAPRNKPLTVLDSATDERDGAKWLELDTSGGRIALVLEASSSALQEEGQAHFGRLCDACGVSNVDNSSDLHGLSFMIVGDSFGPVAVVEVAA